MNPDNTRRPDEIADTTHADPAVVALLRSYFDAKSAKDVDRTQAHFLQAATYYADAVLGWVWDTWDALLQVWKEYMPVWPEQARAYPTRIVGGPDGVVVAFTDTPELFGGEIRGVAAIDLVGDKITRWVDYWDGRAFGADSAAAMRLAPGSFPATFGHDRVTGQVDSRLAAAAGTVAAGLASNRPDDVLEALTEDAVLEDLALRTTVHGRRAIGGYLRRALADLPYGAGSEAVHTLGGPLGGGYEWRSASGSVPVGITIVELDADGRVEALRFMWDSARLPAQVHSRLLLAAAER